MYPKRQTWSSQTIEVLTSAADHTDIFAPGCRVKVHQVMFTVGVLTSGAATVKFDITAGTSRGDGNGGVITIPTATAVNQVVIDTTSTIFPYVLSAGSFITPETTSAAASAGQGFFGIIYEILEETNANDANVAESA